MSMKAGGCSNRPFSKNEASRPSWKPWVSTVTVLKGVPLAATGAESKLALAEMPWLSLAFSRSTPQW